MVLLSTIEVVINPPILSYPSKFYKMTEEWFLSGISLQFSHVTWMILTHASTSLIVRLPHPSFIIKKNLRFIYSI